MISASDSGVNPEPPSASQLNEELTANSVTRVNKRLLSRWHVSNYAPIIGELGDSRGPSHFAFYVSDISLAGAALCLRAPSSSLQIGKIYQCTMTFPSLGELITNVRVKHISREQDRLHAEFCEVTDAHVHLILQYVARFCGHVQLSDAIGHGLTADVLSDGVLFTQEDTDDSEVVTLAATVMNETVLRGEVRSSPSGLRLKALWIRPDFATGALTRRLVAFLSRCAFKPNFTLTIVSTELAAHLELAGFQRKNSAWEIEVSRAIRGKGLSSKSWNFFWKDIHKQVSNLDDVPNALTRSLGSLIYRPISKLTGRAVNRLAATDVSWIRYALHYDKMCSINPAYEANIDLVAEWLMKIGTPGISEVYELGAGTGNVTKRIATLLPTARIRHVDNDPGMNLIARQKYARSGITNVEIVPEDIEVYSPPKNSADLLICVHAAYTLQEPRSLFERAFEALKPEGHLLIIDIGRPINLISWGIYLFANSILQMGLLRTIKLFYEGRQVIRQNQNIHAKQQTGAYWSHDTSSFQRTLSHAGFEVLDSGQCYRGISDYALCRKPA